MLRIEEEALACVLSYRMLTYADVCCMLRIASEDESAAVVETEEEALVCVLSYRIALALVNAGAYVRIRPHTSAYVSIRQHAQLSYRIALALVNAGAYADLC
jgi:hypothetical protein